MGEQMGSSEQNNGQQYLVTVQKMAEMLYWSDLNEKNGVDHKNGVSAGKILNHEHDPNSEEYQTFISDVSGRLQEHSPLDDSNEFFGSAKLVFLNPYTYVGKYTQEESKEFTTQLVSLQIITPEEQAQLIQQIAEAYQPNRHVGSQVLRNVKSLIGVGHVSYRKAIKFDTSGIIEDPNLARVTAEREYTVRIEATQYHDKAIAELTDAIKALRSALKTDNYAARNGLPTIENATHLMTDYAPAEVRLPDMSMEHIPLIPDNSKRGAVKGTKVDPSFRTNIYIHFAETQRFDDKAAGFNEKIWEAYYHLAKKKFNKDRKKDKKDRLTTTFDTNIPILDIINELQVRLKRRTKIRKKALKTALSGFNSDLDS